MTRLKIAVAPLLIFYLLSPAKATGTRDGELFPDEKQAEAPPVQSSLRLKLSGFAQLTFTGSDNTEDTFSVRRARLSLSGEPLKKLRFKIQADLTRSPILIDALAEILLVEKLSLRVGQFPVPFSLESITSAGDLLTINRSQAVEYLAPGRDNKASGRDIGAVISGRFSFLDYSLGLLNGSGINKKDDNNHKDFSGRFIIRPNKDFAAGFSVYNGRQTVAGVPGDLARNRYGFEGNWHYRSVHLSTEFIRAKDGQVEKQGWYLQAVFDLKPGKYQLVFRLDSIDPDRNLPEQINTVYLAGANWYLNTKSKVQANFEYHHPEAGPDNQVLLLHLQVGF
jgi:hypothetical protein